MAKIESIRQHRHTIECTEEDERPVVVTLRRLTQNEWIATERDLGRIRAAPAVHALKKNVSAMVKAAKDGDEDGAQAIAATTVEDATNAAIDKLQALDDYTAGSLAEHIVQIEGLEGVESGGEAAALLEHRPIMLELWQALTDASSLSDTEKKA